jgi:hypothetical protein
MRTSLNTLKFFRYMDSIFMIGLGAELESIYIEIWR